jgi:hypothetical protein
VFWHPATATAQTSSGDYAFMVASGFLCHQSEGSDCEAVARSATGEMYRVSGAGRFNAQSKSVTAAGIFTHESASGSVLTTGVWVATEFVSFNSYGIAPGALSREGLPFRSPPFNPKRLQVSRHSMPTGGLAVLRIRLMPVAGPSTTAVLQINCALGNVPSDRSAEGIRVTMENGPDFGEELTGRVMFLGQM